MGIVVIAASTVAGRWEKLPVGGTELFQGGLATAHFAPHGPFANFSWVSPGVLRAQSFGTPPHRYSSVVSRTSSGPVEAGDTLLLRVRARAIVGSFASSVTPGFTFVTEHVKTYPGYIEQEVVLPANGDWSKHVSALQTSSFAS